MNPVDEAEKAIRGEPIEVQIHRVSEDFLDEVRYYTELSCWFSGCVTKRYS